ncbi:MAG TPA: hypothetical protein VHC43_09880 [Mycobacteriales bacterium]|nr:hypothetical protein [Mycobacteriales bacterium]
MAEPSAESVVRQASGQPARGYSWPPFQPGHELSLKSGAWSPKHVDPLALELLEEVASDPSTAYLGQPAFAGTLRLWAFAQARAELYAEWLAKLPFEEQVRAPKGSRNNRAPIEIWRALATSAANLAAQLGLTPLARARLGRDVATAESAAAAVDRVREAGREAREERP